MLRKKVPNFAVRYVVTKCCHYLHMVVVVLKSLAFCSRGPLLYKWSEIPWVTLATQREVKNEEYNLLQSECEYSAGEREVMERYMNEVVEVFRKWVTGWSYIAGSDAGLCMQRRGSWKIACWRCESKDMCDLLGCCDSFFNRYICCPPSPPFLKYTLKRWYIVAMVIVQP